MMKYRASLPQLQDRAFLTDGGIETTLIFYDKLELPYFAAFHLLKNEAGKAALKRYFARHASIAIRNGQGFILESPTWRASADWADKLGYSKSDLERVNRQSIALMEEMRLAHETSRSPMVISGCIGPRGDGYDSGTVMTPDEAEDYHGLQSRVFAQAGADMVTAITMTNTNEAIGLTRAARAAGMPVAISFTVETDGRLPTGESLGEAIERVDAETKSGPAYYMINCAHPDHFASTLAKGGTWISRIKGLRANASRRSHAELNEAPDLDDGNPRELGEQYGALHRLYRQINVVGGCCGTDHRHIEEIGRAYRPFRNAA
jgi:S-methylmethionine-dependent homocysteine/selenocysteine methylase